METKEQVCTVTMLRGIACWGDSLTQGAGGGGVTWPREVDAYIREHVTRGTDTVIPVVNMGIGGETSATILGRSGAIPFVTDADMTIPADTTPVGITFTAKDGSQVDPLVQNENGCVGVNPCVIAGVRGKLSIVKNTPGEIHIFHGLDKYYFTRETAGDAVTVPAGTEIVTSGNAYRDYFPIVFIGQNGGYKTPDYLVTQIRTLLGAHEDYIIVGLHSGNAENRKNMESTMNDAFGVHYINLRAYTSSEQAIADANTLFDADITPSDENLADMRVGTCPQCLRSDSCHFNAIGYKLVAKQIIDKAESLGYFDKIRATIGKY